jgi:superfamily II DNA or RNA helicase
MPVSFRGRVIQQIGRVTRTGSARPAEVHDFRDSQVPLLERMFGRRRRVMAKQGFRPAQAQP